MELTLRKKLIQLENINENYGVATDGITLENLAFFPESTGDDIALLGYINGEEVQFTENELSAAEYDPVDHSWDILGACVTLYRIERIER